jgi:Txe/YoeB family toxin of Txe-Axe toxin-antitoxin module
MAWDEYLFWQKNDKQKINKINELEIDATTIYSELTGKHFGEIISPKLSHASN